MFLIVPFLFCSFVLCQADFEGEVCEKDGVLGTCVNIRKCQSAIDGLKNRMIPKESWPNHSTRSYISMLLREQACYYDNSVPVVCCVDNAAPAVARPQATITDPPRPVATTTRPTRTTTEYTPPIPDYVSINSVSTGCAPIDKKLRASPTGQRAWDKCLEYQETCVYPCKREAFVGGYSRKNFCYHNADELIAGGENASAYEFPHMVMLGYGSRDALQWRCGGSLISERFILTAGHCTADAKFGPVTHALVGVLRRAEAADPSKVFKVKRIIKHPEYKSPSKYHDIALVELEGTVKLNQYTVPACLHVGDPVDDGKASAAGWGLTNNSGSLSEILLKVILTKFTAEECSVKYPAYRLLEFGVDHVRQVCYGDKLKPKDTCSGDSGGPLHVKSKKINCMYLIVGVTSFGKACGFVGDPGIYTRVAPYVSWIENIVWP